MNEWWNNLTQINQIFYGAAAFFSVFFLWQIISVFAGLDADGDSDTHIDTGDADHVHGAGHDSEADAGNTTLAFKLLSVRSVITFFTLFTWGTALYLSRGDSLGKSLGISSIWGLAGMLSVALIFFLLPKLTQTGTKDLGTAVGTQGNVYLDIPANGSGEVRVTVSGQVSHVRARTADGKALKAGTQIRVVRRLDQGTVEVETVGGTGEKGAKA